LLRGNVKPVIGFWAGENYFRFLDPIIEHLEKGGEFSVRKFNYEGNNKLLNKQMSQCDLTWFEWARGPIEAASKLKKKVPIICRLHKYEAYIDSPEAIEWRNVDKLIFISEAVKDTFTNRFPEQAKEISPVLIRNGIELSKFTANMDRKRGHKIAFNGRFHYHKSPELFLQCAHKLKEINPNYTFHLIGEFIDPVIQEYFWYQVEQMGLNSSVVYDGVIEDVNHWLSDKDYFLQTSIIEGQSVAALEAMACGLKPVMHNYFNSGKVFPEKYLYNTIDEAVSMICDENFSRNEYRSYVVKNNDLEKQMLAIEGLIKELLR